MRENSKPGQIVIAPAEGREKEVLALMKEYVGWLMENDDMMAEVLKNQHLEEELADIAGKYAPPEGRFYVALKGAVPVGCAALCKLEDGICEAKRLYVTPAARGLKAGRLLMEKIVEEARAIGYRKMRLDSFPFMEAAVSMYEGFGFRPIENYNGNPSDNALFFELDLI